MNNFHRFQNFRRSFSHLFSQIRLKKRHTSLFSGTCREIRTKFHQNSQKTCKIRHKKWKIGNSFIHSRKNVNDFLLKFWDLSGAKVCKSCRSRQELSNEYLLAKIGVDTAENEPLKVWRKIQFIIHSPPWCSPSRHASSIVCTAKQQGTGMQTTSV